MRLFLMLFLYALISCAYSCSSDLPIEENKSFSQLAETADIKILAIGNSFTDNATTYLPQITSSLTNSTNVLTARLILGGSSLEQHWNNHISNADVYEFSFTNGSTWNEGGKSSIDTALGLTDWDFVIIQQVSGLSGCPDSFHPFLENLAFLIRMNSPTAKLGWQMTWAYSSNSNHPDFSRYDNSREEMYSAINSTLQEVESTVDLIIPSGKLIELLRQSKFNDAQDLTIDGFHLNTGIPCFALSCLWGSMLFNFDTSSVQKLQSAAEESSLNISASQLQLLSSIITSSKQQ